MGFSLALFSGLGLSGPAFLSLASVAALAAKAVAAAIAQALAAPCGKAPLPRTPLPRATAVPRAVPAAITGMLGSRPPMKSAPKYPLAMLVPGGRQAAGGGALSPALSRRAPIELGFRATFAPCWGPISPALLRLAQLVLSPGLGRVRSLCLCLPQLDLASCLPTP